MRSTLPTICFACHSLQHEMPEDAYCSLQSIRSPTNLLMPEWLTKNLLMAKSRVSEPSDAHLISSLPPRVCLLRPATLIDSVFVSEGAREGEREEGRKREARGNRVVSRTMLQRN